MCSAPLSLSALVIASSVANFTKAIPLLHPEVDLISFTPVTSPH